MAYTLAPVKKLGEPAHIWAGGKQNWKILGEEGV